jgi:hypothetical protein
MTQTEGAFSPCVAVFIAAVMKATRRPILAALSPSLAPAREFASDRERLSELCRLRSRGMRRPAKNCAGHQPDL